MRRLKVPLLPAAAVAVMWWCALATPLRGQTERILNYHSDIELQNDGSLVVQETIEVQSRGQQIRHGIYRDFPTHYRDHAGNQYVVGFELLGAARDGQPETTRVENRANGKRIYLGDANRMLAPGRYTYGITYTTTRQLGFFADHDELFWNVTGNGWVFPIAAASATVRLAGNIPAEKVELSGYTGPQGSVAQELTWSKDEDGAYEFATSRGLGPHEGMTILLEWPKGYFTEPTLEDKIAFLLTDNQDALILGAGLLLVVCYYVIAWYLVGRDPAPGAIVTQYEPPAGFSAAGVRNLVRMGFDNKAFSATVLSLAVKGYLTIQEDSETYTLRRASGGRAQEVFPEEALAGGALFEGRDEIELKNTNHTAIAAAIGVLRGTLKKKESNVLFNTHSGVMIPAVLLSIGMLVAAAYADGSQNVAQSGFLCMWLTIWTLVVSGLVITVGSLWKRALTEKQHRLAMAGQATMTAIFALPFLAGEAFGFAMLVKSASLLIAMLLVAVVGIHILFHYLLKAPTTEGRAVLDKVEGFKRFLTAVEADRLNRMNPPEKTPELFEKYLPFALALDVEQAWAQNFSGILEAAGRAPGGSGGGYSPAWYSGPAFTSGGVGDFTSSLGGSFTSAISSSSQAPGSSGGGGGGSGGGGGGGGGGGW